MIRSKNIFWLWVSFFVIVVDQWTKFLAVTHLVYATPFVVIPHFFNLTLLHNTGAAFSLLAESGGWQRWFFTGIALVMVLLLLRWLFSLPEKNAWIACALSLVIGGAIGNVMDRFRLSYVIDFIQVYYNDYYWPAFNVADSAVVVGVFMLAWHYFFWEKK